jgi:hypothetical protein
LLLIGNRRKGVIGDEQHPVARFPQLGNGVNRASNWLVHQPNDTI